MKLKPLSFLLALAVFAVSCTKAPEVLPPPADEPELPPAEEEISLPDVPSLFGEAGVVGSVQSSSTKNLTNGVSYSAISCTLTSGLKENVFIVAADLNSGKLALRTALPYNSTVTPQGAWTLQSLSDMSYYLELIGHDPISMINADFWNTSTFIPRGPVHCQGTVVWSTFEPNGSSQQGISFVGWSKTAGLDILPSSEYGSKASSFTEVTGSGVFLVKEGKAVDNSSVSLARHPRTAIGYSEKGVVFFFCVDGRDEGVSEGMTYDEMGSIFVALGCKQAVNLDGGGSTQMLVRDPQTLATSLVNKPSDQKPRAVVNGWTLYLAE